MRKTIVRVLWLLVLVGLDGRAGIPEVSRWVLVDTQGQTLSVMEGEAIKKIYRDISIGRFGASDRRVRGDAKTPIGQYRITEVHPKSQFHRFLALDFPNIEDAERAFRDGRISATDRDRILAAKLHGREPPADTPLGGHIGIHGIGSGNASVHGRFNWTQGCVALRDTQLNELMNWVGVGTAVVIR
ncbi:MAG: L,D-transpeptidase [Pseudomonadota bacterium]